MTARLLLVTVAIAAALSADAPVARTDSDPTPEPRLVTPVLSLRRAPGLMARLVADSNLGAEIDRAMGDPVLGGAVQASCLAVSDIRGRTVYGRRAEAALIPASTIKVTVAATVLDRIGAGSRLTTTVRAAAPLRDGVAGDLWLVGGGDPLLSTGDFAIDAGFAGQTRLATSLEALADRIVAAGVRRVEGRVLGDDSRYDRERFVGSWPARYRTELEISPISALVVNKSILVGSRPKVFATEPEIHAANVLADLLAARGVAVAGTGAGVVPPGATTVASVDSPPMADVVGEVLQHSDNLGAEMLLKELGLRFGAGGTTAAGVAVVKAHLEAGGVGPDGMAAADGSGLDRSDRLSCGFLQGVLSRSGEQGQLARALPVAGFSGTLAKRFVGTPAAGKVRAKTGSLDGVVGLGGWAAGSDGRALQFALLANEVPTGRIGAALQDKVVSALARYPQAPPADLLAPRVAGG